MNIFRERERERDAKGKVYLVKMQFAQLSLSSLHYFPNLHLAPRGRAMEKFFAGSRNEYENAFASTTLQKLPTR